MSKESENFAIRQTTKERVPKLPFEAMKNAALGKKYSLSIVFCGEKRMRTLNHTHRRIDKPTDILSFPLDEESGEIFISIKNSRKMMRDFGRELDNFIGFLFIHGLIHLKGFDHGSRMEAEEVKLRRRFKI
ncbi:MAG TPA: rRNA maturation RNase YbeY [Candidatus Paceibacterota bacterium]|jgi:probable rRNA maturation factor|nr:rRNA maturation RNase YbeY [Candidatus Paceibacterota bacterium]